MRYATTRRGNALLATDLHVEATYRLTEALVEAENRMRRRVELLTEVVFEVSAGGHLFFLNQSWRTILGLDPEACLGRLLCDFTVIEDREQCLRALADAAAAQPVGGRRLLRWSHANGDVAWMELSVARLADGGVVGALHDVTQQKRVQDEVAKLSLVASYTQNLVVITDRSGRTEWVNQAFERRTGYTLIDLAGRKPGEVLQGPETDPAAPIRIGALLQRGEPFNDELLNYTKAGDPYWVRLDVTPVRSATGEIERYVSIQTDSTELRRTQQQLGAAKERAELASEAKTQFLATVSHEMRTPLNAILGSAELAMLGDAGPQDVLDHVRNVRESADVLLRLISDMLDVSKIEAGQIDVERAPFDMRACLHSAMSSVAARAQQKGLDFRVTCSEAVPAFVFGDAGRVRQIVTNLAENAVKFTDDGMVAIEVTIEHTDHERHDATREPILQIRVCDTGIGITPAAQARMFDRFVQGDSSITRRQGGAGLGLNIVKSLVDAMSGSITVHSQPGRGADFRVRLPLEAAPAPTVASAHPDTLVAGPGTAAPARPARVLVAEDNDINFVLLEAYLKRDGHLVMRAHNGREAVEAARQCEVIIMDVEMPDMDGLEATRRIRGHEQAQGATAVPIIAVTAHAVLDYRQRCLSAGCTTYLTKPVGMRAVLDAVATALGH